MSDQFFVSLDASSTTSSLKFRPKKKKKPSPFKPPPMMPPDYQQLLQQQLLAQHLSQRDLQPLDLISNSSSVPSTSQHQPPQSFDHFDVNSIYASYNPYVTSASLNSAHAGPLLHQQPQPLPRLFSQPPVVSRRPRPPPPPCSQTQQHLPSQFLPLQVFSSSCGLSASSSTCGSLHQLQSHALRPEAAATEAIADHQRPKCSHCASMIIDEECTEAEGGVYHIKCFACASCRRPLGGQQYIMHSISESSDVREPYCTDCFDSLFGEYCEGCGQLIHVAKGAAITHEGRSWHAIDCCFKCQNCQQSLLGLPFLPHSSGLIFCSVNCSKDAFNPRLRQSANNNQQPQPLPVNSSDKETSATSTPSSGCGSSKINDHEDHAIHSLNCKDGSEMRGSRSISHITRIQDEATPPPLPSLSPSSGCSSSNSLQANYFSSAAKSDDHHQQQQQLLHHERPSHAEPGMQTPPHPLQTSSSASAAASAAALAASPAAHQPESLYSTARSGGRMDGTAASRRPIVLASVREEALYLEDSASSSYYACIGSLFQQAAHPSPGIPVNPCSSPPSFLPDAGAASPAHDDSHAADMSAGVMLLPHAFASQGVEGEERIKAAGDDGHRIASETASSSPAPSLPPRSPTICLITSTPASLAAEGHENPGFKRDDADSSESNNNKNDLIEELESIQIAEQSASKTPKTVSFDETMKEKDSPGGGGRRLRVRRRRGKRHHHHSRRRRQQRRSTRRSGYDCQGNSDDEDGCSCSSCCSSCSSSGSSSSSCSSSSSSDDEESFGLVWPTTTPTAASSLEGEGSAGPHARLQSGVGSQTLAHSATAAGSLTRPSRPDIKRQPNTACLIQ